MQYSAQVLEKIGRSCISYLMKEDAEALLGLELHREDREYPSHPSLVVDWYEKDGSLMAQWVIWFYPKGISFYRGVRVLDTEPRN